MRNNQIDITTSQAHNQLGVDNLIRATVRQTDITDHMSQQQFPHDHLLLRKKRCLINYVGAIILMLVVVGNKPHPTAGKKKKNRNKKHIPEIVLRSSIQVNNATFVKTEVSLSKTKAIETETETETGTGTENRKSLRKTSKPLKKYTEYIVYTPENRKPFSQKMMRV